MGCAPSSDADKVQHQAHIAIEKQLNKDKLKHDIKLLLLGTGECGKSTVLKQMKILHKGGFTEDELQSVRALVYANIFESLDILCNAVKQSNIPFQSSQSLSTSSEIKKTISENQQMTCPGEKLTERLIDLWADGTVKMAFKQFRDKYHVPDGAQYFFENMPRICSLDYIPTAQDALHSRVHTNGIIEVNFIIRDMEFRVFDVGGQRSERRKWIHCFDNVKAIIFITAISEYDQLLKEDDGSNRMTESMELFRQICNSQWFSFKTSLILFLNKMDLFKQKLEKTNINILFKEYAGDNSYEQSLAYIRDQYELRNEYPGQRKVYLHATCATDTNQVQLVFEGVFDTIIQNNISRTGLG